MTSSADQMTFDILLYRDFFLKGQNFFTDILRLNQYSSS